MKTESKSKTFQKGDDAVPDILDFVMKNLKTTDFTPEGTASYGDNLAPHDPQSNLNFKYIVTVTKVL